MPDPMIDRQRSSGGDNNLSIIVAKYEPQVQCSGAVPASLLASCQNIVDTMPASRDFTTWGPESDPLAVVKLPLTYYSRESIHSCLHPIILHGRTLITFLRCRGSTLQIEHSHRRSNRYVLKVPILDRGGGTDGDMCEGWTDGDTA